MRELNISEIQEVNGGNLLRMIMEAIKSGAIYDGIKLSAEQVMSIDWSGLGDAVPVNVDIKTGTVTIKAK